MKKTKILIPALGILALGMAASVTGTVAWFTTSSKATASGISMKANVPTSLFIHNGFVANTAYESVNEPSISHWDSVGSQPVNMVGNALTPLHVFTGALTSYKDESGAAAAAAKTLADDDLLHMAPSTANDATSTSAGTSSQYDALVYLEGGSSEGVATLGDNKANGNFIYAKESIVRRAEDGSTATYGLDATVTLSGISATDIAYKTIRVGFLSSKDNGVTWSFVGQSDATNGDSGEATALAVDSSATSTTFALYHVATGISDNAPICVAPIVWLEGSDTNCFTLNFQKTFNWNISIEYSVA